MTHVRWKLRRYLQNRNISVRKLLETMVDGREATLYRITSPTNPPTRVDLPTLEAIITALRTITGQRVSVCDLLEYEDGLESST